MKKRKILKLEEIQDILSDLSDVDGGDSEYEFLGCDTDTDDDGNQSVHIESSDNEEFDENVGGESSDEEDNIRQQHNTQKRRCMRLTSSSEEENTQNMQIEVSADGTIWKKVQEGGAVGRLPSHCIFKDLPGPTAHARRNIMEEEISSAFLLLIDHHILEHIRNCTEIEASRVLGKKWTLSQEKLKAFIGILYGRGAYEAKGLKLSYLWNKKWGPDFFSENISRNDFTEILRFIRFDKRNERSQRLQTDKFALVSTVWDKFIENSQNAFKPGAFITVDEQLFPTKARCRFTQYMPNKPDKFGIKFWLASDVETKYVINGFPYLGKDEKRNSSTPLSEFVVTRLLEPYIMKGRCVTTDNFFTSLPLASKLLAKNTALVGTVRCNKRELPKICKEKKDGMERFSTHLYETNECTLTVYKSKPNKKVVLLSTKHKGVKIDTSSKKLPETISFYNKTKFGVDVTDQMARKYSVKSGSRRWPLQVFFNILDLAGINSWILYRSITGKNISRKDFLFRLAEELTSEYKSSSQGRASEILRPATQNPRPVRKWCQIGLCNNNKTTTNCDICKKYVCGKCVEKKVSICKACKHDHSE